MILVGHVTKDGQIAGPRVVEQVDAVASFEGDTGHHFRILRAVKNRFGPTDEIGVFEMSDQGLREVANPSELSFPHAILRRPGPPSLPAWKARGRCSSRSRRSLRPSLGTPRRAVVGWDQNRLSMVLAVLEAHGGLRLGMHDVYLNVAGSLRITEPAADRAAAAALVSSLSGAPLPPDTVYFGELGLSGAIRPGRSGTGAAEGSGEARVFPGRFAAAPQGERRAHALAAQSIGHITDLVAGVAGERPRQRAVGFRREG